jgi:hypothetical protein
LISLLMLLIRIYVNEFVKKQPRHS